MISMCGGLHIDALDSRTNPYIIVVSDSSMRQSKHSRERFLAA